MNSTTAARRTPRHICPNDVAGPCSPSVGFLLLMALAGCMVDVRAYPINQPAQQIGILELSYQMGLGHGPVTIKTSDGRTATGEFQTFYFEQAPPDFGILYKVAYKTNPEAGSRAGIANASDTTGRQFYCEY